MTANVDQLFGTSAADVREIYDALMGGFASTERAALEEAMIDNMAVLQAESDNYSP